MNTWKVILATLVIFLAGIVTGVVLVRQSAGIYGRPARPNSTRNGPATPGVMRVEFLRRMQRELNLTPEQHDRIEKILKQSQEHSHHIMEPVLPALQEEFQRTKEEFRQVLTPEQQRKFDELLKHPPRSRESRHPNGPRQPTGEKPALSSTNLP